VTWEPHKVLESLKSDTTSGAEPLSFYHAGFMMLRDAITDFSAEGARRIVVFVTTWIAACLLTPWTCWSR
jgi:hypothetical protein